MIAGQFIGLMGVRNLKPIDPRNLPSEAEIRADQEKNFHTPLVATGIVLLAVGVVMVLSSVEASGKTASSHSAEPTTFPPITSIRVNSFPPGARVLVNGEVATIDTYSVTIPFPDAQPGEKVSAQLEMSIPRNNRPPRRCRIEVSTVYGERSEVSYVTLLPYSVELE